MSDLTNRVWLSGGTKIPDDHIMDVAFSLYMLESAAGRRPKGVIMPRGSEASDMVSSVRLSQRDRTVDANLEILYSTVVLAHARIERNARWLKLIGLTVFVLALVELTRATSGH